MPSPRRRSRERRSRSGSPQRRGQRRSRSRSPRRRSRSRSPKRRSPRRSRTHSPYRRPVKRSRSRSRNRRSYSPRRRSSPSPRGRPIKGRSPSPRGRRGALSPRGGLSRRRSPKGRPQVQRSQRRSPKRSSHNDHDDRWQSPPSASGSRKKRRSASPHERNSPEPYSNIHQKSEFISGITVVTPIRRLMLSDRFETDEQKQQGDIVIEDNVVIAIQRGPHVRHASPVEINREFDSNHVVILRRKDEGSVPIFDREEIKIFGFDSILDENVYEERRIISVVPSTNTAPSKRHHSPEIIRKIQPQTQVKLNFRPDPRYEPLIKLHGSNESDQEKVRIKRVQKNPNDLRHSLSSKRVHDEGEEDDDDGFDARKKIEAKRKGPVSNKGDSDRVFNRLGDRSRERRRDPSKERRSDRRGPSGNRDSSRDRPDRRDREDKNKLPDFKNRPDRFQYEEWKENPEMIPRNPSYFEHDNREGERGFRGRGRGFRGRGPPRGRGRGFRGEGRGFRGEGRGFRGSGRGYSSSGRERESTWKHDLFDKLKEEEEEKPSSTTKN